MDAIINEASQSSLIPFSENDAAIGMVPYIQRGDAMPKIHAGITPNSPIRLFFIRSNSRCIFSFPKTEMIEPTPIPSNQYGKICSNCTVK